MESCLPRHLRTSNTSSSAYHSRPHAHIGFVRIPAHHHNTLLMINFGSIHTNLPSFSHRLSLQSSLLSYERPNALPAASGDNDGDGASWAWSTAALATTTAAVILACVLAGGGGGIRLKGVVGEQAAMAAFAPLKDLKGSTGERAAQALLGISDDEVPKSCFNEATQRFDQLMQEKQPSSYPDLQEIARVLIKSKEAEKMIQALQRKFEEFTAAEDGQNAYEMGLILAEMLIYHGDHKGAINILHCDFFNTRMAEKDVRPDLYRVAANLMCGNITEAKQSWGYLQSKKHFMTEPDSETSEKEHIPITIQEFQDALRKRLAEIRKARKSWWRWW